MNILIIDDDDDVIDFISRIIGTILPGAELDYAYYKKTALELLSEKEYEIITLDGKLKEGHGRDILKEMTPAQIEKTIVYSGDLNFLNECSYNKVSAIGKNDNLLRGLEAILSTRGII